MNAPPSAVHAVVKAHRPLFRSLSEKVAFACHAVASANGLRLLAVGEHVDSHDLNDHSGPEVDVEGWNARPGEYAFLYAYERAEDNRGGAGAGTLLLKCLAIAGDTLLAVTLLSCRGAGTDAPAPATLELPLARVAVPPGVDAASGDATGVARYGNLQMLLDVLQPAISKQLGAEGSGGGGGGGVGGVHGSAVGAGSARGDDHKAGAGSSGSGNAGGQAHGTVAQGGRLQDPVRGGGDGGGGCGTGVRPGGLADDPTRDPLMVGVPRRGGMHGGGMYGGAPPGMFGPDGGLGGIGGMHVGPGDPIFSGRVRHPVGTGRGGAAQPGMRWDPIAPEGLEGWRPEDFQRGAQQGAQQGGPPLHPDLAQPGPGRGADWDHMFG